MYVVYNGLYLMIIYKTINNFWVYFMPGSVFDYFITFISSNLHKPYEDFDSTSS